MQKSFVFLCSVFLGLNLSPLANALTLEERVELLEREKHQPHAEKHSHTEEQERFLFSGFGSFTASQMTEDAIGPAGETNDLSVNPNSLFGLQLDVQLSDSTRAVAQLVSEGKEDFDLDVEWLFVEQQILPSTAIKIGRFGYPVYGESRNGKVGYTYPTVSLNDEVYIRSIVESVDGLSLDFTGHVGYWTGLLNIYGGEREVTKQKGSITLKTDAVYGVSAELNNGPWDFQAGWHVVNESTTTFNDIILPTGFFNCTSAMGCPLVLEMKNKQWQGAVKYQSSNWYIAYEASSLTSDNDLVGDIFGQSFTLAYSVDILQPYLQWGHYDTKFDSSKIKSGTNDRQQQSVTLGLRHDFQPNLALKYQAKYVYDLDDTKGLFNYYNSETIDFDEAWMFDISLQFVFNSVL